MIAIVDDSIPEAVKKSLSKYTEIVFLHTEGITYDAISGHPDIFFAVVDEHLVVAPNLPVSLISRLNQLNIEYVFGSKSVGGKYPYSASYNAVITDHLLIHNLKITDAKILSLAKSRTLIDVPQGYCRCNLQMLDNNHFITSDKIIFEKLSQQNFKGIFVQPESIILPGFPYGFIGGCCGLFEKNLFMMGSLKHLKEKKIIEERLPELNIELIELYDGPLFDGGSILFV